jgi:N-acetylglucosamine-6-phosphate deacetylase
MPDPGSRFAVSATTVFDGERFLSDHCVIVDDGTVTQVLPEKRCPAGVDRVMLAGGTLAPGFIDLQVNGGGDVLFNNQPTLETLATMQAAHRATGTTSMLPTLLSDTLHCRQQAVAAVRAARESGNPGILGIHLEGPWFAAERRGAHRADLLQQPTAADIDWLCSLAEPHLMVTLAPEQVGAGVIARLNADGILVCAGHTDAGFEQISEAADHGLQGITHLFNAMSPLTSRAPGTVGAALVDDRLWVGIIADGHHLHPANIRLAHRSKPAGRMVLVTDAMATVGGRADSFELYGEQVRRVGNRLIDSAGTLAGSDIGMIDAVRYTTSVVGLPLAECLRMASLYPAAILQLDDRLGRIAAGYRGDLVHFDQDFVVTDTWLAGRRTQHR